MPTKPSDSNRVNSAVFTFHIVFDPFFSWLLNIKPCSPHLVFTVPIIMTYTQSVVTCNMYLANK